MIGYKIRYGEYGHDCWGAREWFGWYDYDNVVYLKYEKAEKVMEDAKKQFPDRSFEIYETKVVEK
jgi:hypothetical protein